MLTNDVTGDPREAEAIPRCFSPEGHNIPAADSTPLYVGSVKTVIGYTEGTAGLAGLLKGTVSLQPDVFLPIFYSVVLIQCCGALNRGKKCQRLSRGLGLCKDTPRPTES